MPRKKRRPLVMTVHGRRIPVRRRSLPRSIWGFTYLDDPEPEIQVSTRLRSSRSILATTWHEALHHAFPKLKEREVLAIEQQTLRLLLDNPDFTESLLREARSR